MPSPDTLPGVGFRARLLAALSLDGDRDSVILRTSANCAFYTLTPSFSQRKRGVMEIAICDRAR